MFAFLFASMRSVQCCPFVIGIPGTLTSNQCKVKTVQ